MDLVLGIDLGTSYFKLGLFDRRGELRGLGRSPVRVAAGDGALCELPVEAFWWALNDGLAEALTKARAKPGDIRAIAYSSQANSFVLLDRHDRPLTPLVLWPDERAGESDGAVEKLWEREDFLTVTGLGMAFEPAFAVAKLRWFRRRRGDIWSAAARIMSICEYLVFSLTGRAIGDAGTASLLGILDLRKCDWWDEALETLDISRRQLSAPMPPGTIAGAVHSEGSRRLGVTEGIPLAVGGLDHHVAAVGAGVGALGQLSESTGTVLACLCHEREYEPTKDCCMGPWAAEGGYYRLAFSNNGAAALEWYRREHCPQLSIPELCRLAEAVPIGCEGLRALPSSNTYAGLEGFVGRTAAHGHGHFVRAILESTAAGLVSLVGRLRPRDRPRRIVATGGGAQGDLWLQIKADLLGAEIVRSACLEPACMGAAMIASVAARWFADIEEATAAWVRADRAFSPRRAARESYAAWLAEYLRTIEGRRPQ